MNFDRLNEIYAAVMNISLAMLYGKCNIPLSITLIATLFRRTHTHTHIHTHTQSHTPIRTCLYCYEAILNFPFKCNSDLDWHPECFVAVALPAEIVKTLALYRSTWISLNLDRSCGRSFINRIRQTAYKVANWRTARETDNLFSFDLFEHFWWPKWQYPLSFWHQIEADFWIPRILSQTKPLFCDPQTLNVAEMQRVYISRFTF